MPGQMHQEAGAVHMQSAFYEKAWKTVEVRTALVTNLGTMTHHFIWLLYHREGVPRMSSLTSWMVSARTTRGAWQARKPIRRGRLTARSTVFSQSVFEVLDPRIRLGQLFFQWEQLSYQGFKGTDFLLEGLAVLLLSSWVCFSWFPLLW